MSSEILTTTYFMWSKYATAAETSMLCHLLIIVLNNSTVTTKNIRDALSLKNLFLYKLPDTYTELPIINHYTNTLNKALIKF